MTGKELEQRSEERKIGELSDGAVRMKIRFRGLTETTMKAVIVDVSAQGIGIAMPEPISPGQVVQFIGLDPSLDIPAQGTVMWNMCEGTTCRAGLKFDK